jgi:hypothetical protein
MEGHPKRVRRSRCGSKGMMRRAGNTALAPTAGRGTQARRCVGCQFAEWHPLCESLIDVDGTRVDLGTIPRLELAPERLSAASTWTWRSPGLTMGTGPKNGCAPIAAAPSSSACTATTR